MRSRARANGLPQQAEGSLATPWGRVWVLAGPRGLTRVALPPAGAIADGASASPLEASRRLLDEAITQLEAYFAGTLRRFTLPLDLAAGTPFERRVWQATAQIEYGRVRTYGELAALIGNPLGARAVGKALGRNPVPVVVPCHRVIQQGGGLGGFSSGIDLKRKLLAHEGYLLDIVDGSDR